MRAWLNFSTGVIHVTKNKRKAKKIKEIIQRKPPRKIKIKIKIKIPLFNHILIPQNNKINRDYNG